MKITKPTTRNIREKYFYYSADVFYTDGRRGLIEGRHRSTTGLIKTDNIENFWKTGDDNIKSICITGTSEISKITFENHLNGQTKNSRRN